MNQRRQPVALNRILIIGAVVIVLAAVVWAVFFRDSDSSKSNSKGTSTPTTLQTFRVTGVPFTFKYPANFAQVQAPAGFIWIAGVSPVDILDVRKVDSRVYSSEGLKTVFGTKLKGQSGVHIVGTGTDVAGGLKTVTYTVTSGTTTPLTSKLIYFSTGGASWQLECQSQAKNRAAIDVACAQALATFTTS